MTKAAFRVIISSIIILATEPIFFSGSVFAEDEITISLSNVNINIDTTPGTFNTGSETITVSTTSQAGYSVSINTNGSTNDLINIVDNSKVIPTFTLQGTQTKIPVAELSDGYGISIDGGSNYLPTPTPSTPKQIFESNEAGAHQYTLLYGVKAATNTPPGTYTNSFSFTAVAKINLCPANTICYNGNGDDTTGTMNDQSIGQNSSATLIPSNYSRPGYGFAGWNTTPDGTGTNYGPSQTITTGNLPNSGLQLYAKWVASSGSMQSFNNCKAMNPGDVIALTDTRDGNTYAITRQADERCWMIENLRLDLSNPNLEISEINTNNPSASFANTINTAHPASNNTFCEANNPDTTCVDVIAFNTNNINRTLTASYNANNNNSSWYSYGVYYNWYTATAGRGTLSFSTNGAAVEGDICPAGWRLPTGFGNNGDFAKLDVLIGGNGKNQITEESSARWRRYPLNFIYSGEQRGSSGYNRDISGDYNTANTSTAQRSVNYWLQKTAVSLNSNNTLKPRGQTIRCIKSDSYSAIGNIHYDSNGGTGTMQDATNVDLLTATAANNEFTKAHSDFAYWNTKADGSGTTVLEGGTVANAASDMGISDGGTLTLYAIWRSIYDIEYDGNGADAGVMASSLHGDITQSTSINLIAPNYSRSGYGFAGWSLDQLAASKLTNGETVKIYGPNERVALNNELYSHADSQNIITFYAVWVKADANYTMQTFDSATCNSLTVGTITALTDIRDNNTYTIAKLADNKCWMIENLRLIPSEVVFSTANTNSPTSSFMTEAASSSTSNTLCGQNEASCVNTVAYNTNNINWNLTPRYDSNTKSSMWYSYGVMYNWYTASAGNGTFSMSSGSVIGDICPTGWKIPTGGNNGEYYTLVAGITGGSLTTDTLLRKYPNNLIYSGDFNQTTFGGRSTYGRIWSGTAANSQNAYRLGFTSNEITPVKSYGKWDAFAIRCIKK